MTEDADYVQNVKAPSHKVIDASLPQQVTSPTWGNADRYAASQTTTTLAR